jgi:hypothetical protein
MFVRDVLTNFERKDQRGVRVDAYWQQGLPFPLHLGACGDLLKDLGAILAAEHGQLPHGPVAVVLVAAGDGAKAGAVLVAHVGLVGSGELEAGGEAVADDVVDLLADLLGGEGGQEREGLEELVVLGGPAGRGG